MLDCTSVLYYRLLFVIEVCRETDSGKSFVRGKKSSHTSNHVHLRVSFQIDYKGSFTIVLRSPRFVVCVPCPEVCGLWSEDRNLKSDIS